MNNRNAAYCLGYQLHPSTSHTCQHAYGRARESDTPRTESAGPRKSKTTYSRRKSGDPRRRPRRPTAGSPGTSAPPIQMISKLETSYRGLARELELRKLASRRRRSQGAASAWGSADFSAACLHSGLSPKQMGPETAGPRTRLPRPSIAGSRRTTTA